MYRDIKPENIGFDVRGDVKVFDFGLAKELTHIKPLSDGTYKLTEETGSPRYMAPEVALGQPYNEKCDTYSMAILIWQMLAGKEPFENYTTMKSLRTRVWEGGKRPIIDESWSQTIKLALTRGWTEDVRGRHTMKNLEKILKDEVTRLRNGDTTGLEHTRRRSTFVFRGANRKTPSFMDDNSGKLQKGSSRVISGES